MRMEMILKNEDKAEMQKIVDEANVSLETLFNKKEKEINS